MSPVKPKPRMPPGQPLGTGVGAHGFAVAPDSHEYESGADVLVPLAGSTAKGSTASASASPSSLASLRSETKSRSQSWGASAAEQGSVVLSISSAFVYPSWSSSIVGSSTPAQGGGTVPP